MIISDRLLLNFNIIYGLRSLIIHARVWSKINHVCFCYMQTRSLLSAILKITHGKRVLFIQNVYKFCNNQIEHEAVAKISKGETIESGALKFFGVNRLSKDLGVQYLISCKQ